VSLIARGHLDKGQATLGKIVGGDGPVVGPIGPLPTPFFRIFLASSASVTNTYTVLTGRYN
jgi:hypothetical protein